MRSRMCLMQDLAILLRSHKLSIIVIVFCFDVKMISTIFYCRAEQKYLESMKKILIVFDFYCNFRLLHNKSTCTWTIWYLCLWNDFFHAYSLLVNYFFQWSNRKIIFHGFVVEAFWNVQNKSCIQNIFKKYQRFF